MYLIFAVSVSIIMTNCHWYKNNRYLLLAIGVDDSGNVVVRVLLVPRDHLVPENGAQQSLNLKAWMHQAPRCRNHASRQRPRHANVGDQLSQIGCQSKTDVSE